MQGQRKRPQDVRIILPHSHEQRSDLGNGNWRAGHVHHQEGADYVSWPARLQEVNTESECNLPVGPS